MDLRKQIARSPLNNEEDETIYFLYEEGEMSPITAKRRTSRRRSSLVPKFEPRNHFLAPKPRRSPAAKKASKIPKRLNWDSTLQSAFAESLNAVRQRVQNQKNSQDAFRRTLREDSSNR